MAANGACDVGDSFRPPQVLLVATTEDKSRGFVKMNGWFSKLEIALHGSRLPAIPSDLKVTTLSSRPRAEISREAFGGCSSRRHSVPTQLPRVVPVRACGNRPQAKLTAESRALVALRHASEQKTVRFVPCTLGPNRADCASTASHEPLAGMCVQLPPAHLTLAAGCPKSTGTRVRVTPIWLRSEQRHEAYAVGPSTCFARARPDGRPASIIESQGLASEARWVRDCQPPIEGGPVEPRARPSARPTGRCCATNSSRPWRPSRAVPVVGRGPSTK
jgi:hypothetical protein